MLWKQYQILRIKSCVLKAHILIQKKNDFINQHYYHTEAELYTVNAKIKMYKNYQIKMYS